MEASTIRILKLLGLILGNAALYRIYKMLKTAYFSKLLKIPGLPYGPLYGNVLESIQGEAMDASIRWVKKYGGIVRFYHIFGRERVLVADPDSIRHVLVTKSTNYLRPGNSQLREILSGGLIVVEGDVHRSERKLLNPSLNSAAVKGFLPLFIRKASELVEKFDQLLSSQPSSIDVQQYIKATTMDVIGLAAFNYDLKAIQEPHSKVVTSLDYVISSQQRSLFASLPFHRYLPTAANKAFKEAVGVVNDLCFSTIKKKRQEASHAGSSILSLLMTARYDDGVTGLKDSALRDHILTFWIAGHETTSLSLTWLLYELAKNPEKQEKLFDEVADIELNSVDVELLDSLQYLNSCVKEILRLYPAAPSITREAKSDDVINGYEIPAGSQLVIHFGTMMRTAVEDGNDFKPERFLENKMPMKWLPFGIGPHACIGNKFALTEMKLLVFYLAKNYRFKPVTDLVIHRKYRLVLRPIPNVRLIVEKR